MTYLEIMKILQEKVRNVRHFAFDEFGSRTGTGSIFIDGIGECQEIITRGGEDQGSEWWSIKYFPDHDIYIKVEGYYSSYNGTDFDNGWGCCSEVRPKEKLIIVYE